MDSDFCDFPCRQLYGNSLQGAVPQSWSTLTNLTYL